MRTIHIPSIKYVLRGQQVLLCQSLMDRLRFLNILGRGGGGLHIDQQMWGLLVAGFGEMHFVSCPDRTAFDAHVSIGVIGRGNVKSSRRNILIWTPIRSPLMAPVLLY